MTGGENVERNSRGSASTLACRLGVSRDTFRKLSPKICLNSVVFPDWRRPIKEMEGSVSTLDLTLPQGRVGCRCDSCRLQIHCNLVMRFQICKQLSAWLPSPRIRLAYPERAPRINLQTLAQWVLDFIKKAARRRKELDGKTEIRRLPGGFDDAEDAETEDGDE